jgi:FKBP-type peptidyl-prolyl cis-trans isomerase
MRILFAALSALFIFSCTAESQVNAVKPTNKKDTASYAVGVNIGNNLRKDAAMFNFDMVIAGIRDAIADKSLITPEQMQAAFMSLQQEMQEKAAAERGAASKTNREKGEKFLAENKGKEGVMSTASGLQYKVVRQGTGAKPTASNTVKVHYEGKLLDGKVFDSSYQRNAPIEFPLNGVIAGWTEGVQLMSVGSKYTFFIPSDLAYGEQGGGGDIGPNEVLVFDVELLDITK